MKLTERGQKVLRLAQVEAIKSGKAAVGSEHLLLGLFAEGEGVAAKALQTLGIEEDKIRQEINKITGGGEAKPTPSAPAKEVVLTPRGKKVIELAADEARKMGVGYVGTEHILIGILREGEGAAARLLNNKGVTTEKVRQQVLNLLGGAGSGIFTIFGGTPFGGFPQAFEPDLVSGVRGRLSIPTVKHQPWMSTAVT